MSGFPILDLILGLIFIFFILSIITSSLVEAVLTVFRLRGKILGRWLITIFDKKMIQPDGTVLKLGQAIMDHCLITALSKEGKSPSFIDAKNFVSALVEKLTFHPESPEKVAADLDDILRAIRETKAIDGTPMLSTELQRTMLIFGAEAKLLAEKADRAVKDGRTAFQIFREKMENWFDSSMDRIGGKLKKKYARPLTFWLGAVIVVAMNADTIRIAEYLYAHPDESKQFADRAAVVIKSYEGQVDHIRTLQAAAGTDQAAPVTVDTLQQQVAKMQQDIDRFKETVPQNMPLGWSDPAAKKGTLRQIIGHHFVGWLATVMAIMLGAPFWFDLFNKISNIRGSGNKPASSTDKERVEKFTDK